MKVFKRILLTVLLLVICLSFSSCTRDSHYEALYRELESDYYELEEECLNKESSIEETKEYYSEIIEYYELLCKENGFLTYEQAYSGDYCYVEPGALIYHTDFYCKKANSSNLKIVDIFLYSALDECPECEAVYYDIRLVDPITKLYHNTYEPCAAHFTKDFKTLSTPYIATTEQKAKELKYAPCPACIRTK